jgi:ABC-2 type transport system permease protein
MRRAPYARMLAAQLGMELLLAARRGESVLATLIIPPVLLVFLASAPGLAETLGVVRTPVPVGAAGATGASVAGNVSPAGAFLPGTLALAVMSTSMVSLGIATAYERSYGVLKRLGGSPLPRPVLISGKLLAVFAMEALQTLLLLAVAVALGWRATGSPLLVALGVLLGTGAFGGIGLWMAGSWRAEATLAGANGLYLLLLLFGGLVVPASALPGPLGGIASLLPSAALAEVLRAGLGSAAVEGVPGALLVLGVWAVVSPLVAAATFRWE